jgi:mRNA-degrading endonuclease YafQ of YafQ-DinJ toxin-antitoxin module
MAKKLRILRTFKKDYKKLPSEIKTKVDKQIGLLLNKPEHPSLNLHQIRGTKSIWEGYVDYQYRFTFEIERDYYILRKVGSHDVIKKP